MSQTIQALKNRDLIFKQSVLDVQTLVFDTANEVPGKDPVPALFQESPPVEKIASMFKAVKGAILKGTVDGDIVYACVPVAAGQES